LKFDDHLAQYLYENKFLKLQGIGTFTLDGKVSLPNASEKEIYYPIEGLAFTYNPKEVLDETVITFLVKRLAKIQPLVRSDLDSYLSNIKQFINLGKPYTIEGIGTLSKNNKGLYEFTPGNFLPAKEELNPRRENAEHNYPVSSNTSAGKVFIIILIVLASLAALGGIGWGISTLLSKKIEANNEVQEQQGQLDTLPQQAAAASQPVRDTTPQQSTKPIDTLATTAAAATDSQQYRMIFEYTKSRARALSRTATLTNVHHKLSRFDSIANANGVTYRLFVPLTILPQDTASHKRSLKIFFGRDVIVEKF
jgi:flagellar basal body-associated protein FliL